MKPTKFEKGFNFSYVIGNVDGEDITLTRRKDTLYKEVDGNFEVVGNIKDSRFRFFTEVIKTVSPKVDIGSKIGSYWVVCETGKPTGTDEVEYYIGR